MSKYTAEERLEAYISSFRKWSNRDTFLRTDIF